MKYTNHEAYIKAMEETIRKYARAIGDGGVVSSCYVSCSLCKVSGVKNRTYVPQYCKECPWVKITGSTCITRMKKGDIKYTNRIAELQEWIDLYKADMEESWEPEVGEMIEVSDESCCSLGPRLELRGIVDGQYVCKSDKGYLHVWKYARPIKGEKKCS